MTRDSHSALTTAFHGFELWQCTQTILLQWWPTQNTVSQPPPWPDFVSSRIVVVVVTSLAQLSPKQPGPTWQSSKRTLASETCSLLHRWPFYAAFHRHTLSFPASTFPPAPQRPTVYLPLLQKDKVASRCPTLYRPTALATDHCYNAPEGYNTL